MTVARARAIGDTGGVIGSSSSLAGALALACALASGACGITGTIDLELVAAPGSTLPDAIVRARLTLSDPPRTVEVTRDPGEPVSLSIDVTADGRRADLVFEGFDAAGARIAYGRTPPLQLGAFDGTLAIYVAAPNSLAAAPVAMEPARRAIGTAAFPFGVLVAGGISADGAVSDAVSIYSVVTHRWVPEGGAIRMPAPRAGIAVGASGSGYAYFFGGTDAAGNPTGTTWQFDTTVAPAGVWRAVGDDLALARSGAVMALVAPEAFVVTGRPPVVIDGLSLQVVPATTIEALTGTATSNLVVDERGDEALFATFVGEGNGESGVVRIGAEQTLELPAPASAERTNHGAAPTRDGRTVAIGGGIGLIADGPLVRSALVIDPQAETVEERPDVLAVGRADAAVAASGGRLLVAGGMNPQDGTIVSTAEIFDDVTLAPLGVVPMVVPRTRAVARPLANGQIAIFGGVDETGAPVSVIELYTPDP